MNTATISRKARQHIDFPLILIALAIATFGVVAVTAATYSYSSETPVVNNWFARIAGSYYGARQGLFLIISPFVIAAMTTLSYRMFQKFAQTLYIASLVVLVAVLAVGTTTSGVTGWFEVFSSYMIQPSEFAKLAIILYTAKFFARKENPVTTMRDFLTMGVIMALPVLLVVSQGEMGTVIVFLVIDIAMMLASGMHLWIIGALLGGGVTLMIPLVLYMRSSGSYRYERIIAFIDPSQVSADALYQARNSQIAIGNGGLRGVGLFKNGTFTALNYVPQDHTDFIFSSIGESMGFIGCVAVLLMFSYMLYRLLALALNTYDKYARLVIIGVFAMIFFHVFYNIGMTIGTTPVMGIPLPFLSYGGSNLTANMAAIGLVVNITYRKPMPRSGSFAPEAASIGTIRNARKRARWQPEA